MGLSTFVKEAYGSRFVREELGLTSLDNDHIEELPPMRTHQPGHAAVSEEVNRINLKS